MANECNSSLCPVTFKQERTDEAPVINLRLFSSLTPPSSSSDGSV